MERRGRPAVPNEVKRLRGTARADRGAPTKVLQLRPADGIPDPPPGLGLAGTVLWNGAWHEAIVWLSPLTDMRSVERAARLADSEETAHTRYMATHEAVDARAYVALSHELGIALAELGFGPVARTRMGVAEVTRVSKMDSLRRKSTGERG